MQEAKEAAQRKAQEQRKLEQQRLEQQRAQMLAKQKQSNDLAAKLQQEKAQAQAPPRADLGASRPVSRFNTIQDQTRPVPHPPINPAKPPKRPKPEDDNDQKAPQRVGPSYQQTEGKRRRTEEADEEEEIEPRHSVKAPPIRHSNMRKVSLNPRPIVMNAHSYLGCPEIPTRLHKRSASCRPSSFHVQVYCHNATPDAAIQSRRSSQRNGQILVCKDPLCRSAKPSSRSLTQRQHQFQNARPRLSNADHHELDYNHHKSAPQILAPIHPWRKHCSSGHQHRLGRQ